MNTTKESPAEVKADPILLQLEAAAKALSVATNSETEVSASVQVDIAAGCIKSVRFGTRIGDCLNRGKWKWNCQSGNSLDGALTEQLAHIARANQDVSRERRELEERAAKLGLILTPGAVSAAQ